MTTPTSSAGPALRISLWITQGLLAVSFGFAGVMKSTAPIEQLIQKMVWPGAVPEGLVRFIGVSEFLGALGLILPSVTRIQPKLTPLAAMGLVTVMLLAMGFHASRGEFFALPINGTLGGLAAFIAWGRWKAAPIPPRDATG